MVNPNKFLTALVAGLAAQTATASPIPVLSYDSSADAGALALTGITDGHALLHQLMPRGEFGAEENQLVARGLKHLEKRLVGTALTAYATWKATKYGIKGALGVGKLAAKAAGLAIKTPFKLAKWGIKAPFKLAALPFKAMALPFKIPGHIKNALQAPPTQ